MPDDAETEAARHGLLPPRQEYFGGSGTQWRGRCKCGWESKGLFFGQRQANISAGTHACMAIRKALGTHRREPGSFKKADP